MLEYMILRPIERSIWEATRKWLNESERNVLTVVLDEAHMYTGARGSEVAHLLRRLYDRLGVRPRQLRCIATSATLGEGEGAEAPIRAFVSRLFGVASERFEVIRAEADPELSLEKATYEVDEQFASALAGFQRELNDGRAIQSAAADLLDRIGESAGEDASARLASRLKDDPHVRQLQRSCGSAQAWTTRLS